MTVVAAIAGALLIAVAATSIAPTVVTMPRLPRRGILLLFTLTPCGEGDSTATAIADGCSRQP